MAAVDDPKTLGRTRLSFASEADIDEFVATLEKFESGELTPDQWRVFRLVRGTYGQRQPGDVQMLRVKIPQGVLTAPQLEALAEVGERFSRGFGHITTRQNIQFHFVKLHDVETAMRMLADAGLTTREACGNSVRNITCCPKAGVSPTELFDVTPYSEAMTRYLLRHPLSSSLPRKFKIAFEGCTDEDHALLGMHDLGYRAAITGRQARFPRRRRRRHVDHGEVGGAGARVSAGVRDVQRRRGGDPRVSRSSATTSTSRRTASSSSSSRSGWDDFLAEYNKKLAEFRAQGGATLPFDPEHPPVEAAPAWRRIDSPPILETVSRATSSQVTGPGIVPQVRPMLPTMNGDYSHWLSTNVRKQKQSGYFFVNATIRSGRLHEPADAHPRRSGDRVRRRHDAHHGGAEPRVPLGAHRRRARAVPPARRRRHGIGRCRHDCRRDELPRRRVVQARGDAVARARQVPRRSSARAPGARVPRRPICKSRSAAARTAADAITSPASDSRAACARSAGRAVPQYFVMVGGGPEGDGVRFGRLAAKMPARRMTEALERLIDLYVKERHAGESATTFFMRVDVGSVKAGALRSRKDDAGDYDGGRLRRPRGNRRVQTGNSRRRVLGVASCASW